MVDIIPTPGFVSSRDQRPNPRRTGTLTEDGRLCREHWLEFGGLLVDASSVTTALALLDDEVTANYICTGVGVGVMAASREMRVGEKVAYLERERGEVWNGMV